MKTPHKHAALIHAWAEGEVIQYRAIPGGGEWQDYEHQECLMWDSLAEYRIKPEVKPDVIKFIYVGSFIDVKEAKIYEWKVVDADLANLRLTMDGETGKLKKAEVLE